MQFVKIHKRISVHIQPQCGPQKQIRKNSTNSVQTRRVVVTGIGLLTPLGIDTKTTWQNLIEGKSGIKPITSFDTTKYPSKIGGCITRGNQPGEFDDSKWIPKNSKKSDATTFIQFALAATHEALHDSGWNPPTLPNEDQEVTGVAIGTGIGGLDEIGRTALTLEQQGPRRVSPHFVPKILVNSATGYVSQTYSLKGPNHAVSTACATSSNSLGDAFRMIKYGDADVMVSGGTEACICPLAVSGFCSLRALSTHFNDTPEKASRPFDKDRDGFVIGEGAGIVILEELEHAKRRNAKIYGEIVGYGMAGDAYHITGPTKEGDAAQRAMKAALREARLLPNAIGYINAHATSTKDGDSSENKAMKSVFAEHSKNLLISSTKSAVGHLLGAAGAVEAIFSLLAIHHGVVPPTLNLDNPEPEFDLDYVPKEARKKQVQYALSNSFGFGGVCTSLAIAKYIP